MTRRRRWLLGLGLVIGVPVIGIAITLAVAHEPRPVGRRGPEADALAARVTEAVDLDAWARTGAVTWRFSGRNEHLWDRERHVARVRWDEDTEALIHEAARGRAYRGGQELTGEPAREVLEDAYARFINDSYWLNPLASLRDEGVTRARVALPEGGQGLLISYASGGLTPGDAYLWILGPNGRPRAWRMWVSVFPIGGVEASWERWVELDSGAWVATLHRLPLGLTLELRDVRGSETLAALLDGQPDPFLPLFEATP